MSRYLVSMLQLETTHLSTSSLRPVFGFVLMAASDKSRLHVGVIGAGIAGLSAAIGLTRAGHDVVVSLALLLFDTAPFYYLRLLSLLWVV